MRDQSILIDRYRIALTWTWAALIAAVLGGCWLKFIGPSTPGGGILGIAAALLTIIAGIETRKIRSRR